MVKVYKTNVNKLSRAKSILNAIRKTMPDCDPSFDLEDCDKVLRIEYYSGKFKEQEIRKILANYGYFLDNLP